VTFPQLHQELRTVTEQFALGDGVLVYLGYPQAHEDDAERAVRAGRPTRPYRRA
jgi:hypothetical protein